VATNLKVRKGDEVMVIAGKDRGKRGRVQEVNPVDNTVVVAGVNMAKRHTKPNPSKNSKGGIIDSPKPMALGKVMVICNHCGKPTRVGLRREEDNKERVCKQCGETIVIEEKA
jgi:large subunit ribosomal protein L24